MTEPSAAAMDAETAAQRDSEREAGAYRKQAQGLMRRGDFAAALTALAPGLQGDTADSEARYLAAVCYRYLHQPEDARRVLDALLAEEPGNGRALQELAHLLRDLGETEQAVHCYQQALRSNPALIASFEHCHQLLTALERHAEAAVVKAQLQRAKALPPALLAVTDLLAQGRILKAEALCRQFLQRTPHHPRAMSLLAEIGVQLGALEEAHFLLESACELEPNDPQLRIELIRVLGRRQRFGESLSQARHLLSSAPDNLQYQSIEAIELLQLGHYDEAIRGFERILQRLPGDPVTLTSMGHALKTCGRTEDAVDAYRQATKEPQHGEAWYALANLKTYRFSDREIDSMLDRARSPWSNMTDRVYLDFALGKAMEDREEYAMAFQHFRSGNDLKRGQLRYRSESFSEEVKAQREHMTAELFERLSGSGADAADPIFIVGMPRAGSTLVEQILAAHSSVEGTRELPNILSMAQRLRRKRHPSQGTPGYPAILKDLDPADLRALGDDYLEQTRIHRSDSPFFIDKMPNNFRHIGLIHLILPHAKIIDARREPMACCFSNFQQLFAEGQEFSYDLTDLGRYYRDYVRLMAHWDTVLPGRVHRLQHEALLDDFEGELRRLLDYLELPFEERCLRFYESDRAVRTPSSEQVRQPLFRSAMNKWLNYEPWLAPLRDALESPPVHTPTGSAP